jgi:hypothetical protein
MESEIIKKEKEIKLYTIFDNLYCNDDDFIIIKKYLENKNSKWKIK